MMTQNHNFPRKFILDLAFTELAHVLQEWGEPSYRTEQIWRGLYQQLWTSPEQFTTLPKRLRQRLDEAFTLSHLKPATSLRSSDGNTTKTLFQLPDGLAIETVLMRYERRNTLCISTQVGCAMGCVFCATGQMGFKRHLSPGEIVEQVLYYARLLRQEGEEVTNIVVMGMGEPFHNYDATMKAIDILNHPQGMNLGARRFTISTVGLVPAIRRFADEKRQVNLAISLHATRDDLRSSLLPINRKYSIQEVLSACRDYVAQTGRRITFEWALIQDVNDSVETARELATLLKGLLCHVNVIPLNPTRRYPGTGSTRERANAFKAELERQTLRFPLVAKREINDGS
ncbi:MAG: 23S rRNA (adenine(2503)-C(2))-methyltransferase RlmN, partial [Thermanaerothrix sp.]|nr:23S rRNA (adenine(2503)-C(2))-methyltransferase RlmN [Thermanaerothrix sp.]